MNNESQANANALKLADNEIGLTLFVLPKGTLCYFPPDKQPTTMNRTDYISLREVKKKYWAETSHDIYWGHYLLCVVDINADRKILDYKPEPVRGLAEAFARGTSIL